MPLPPPSLEQRIDLYLDAKKISEGDVDAVLGGSAKRLGDWSQIVLARLSERLQESLDRHLPGSEPNVEQGELGRLLERWNVLGVHAALRGRALDAEQASREMLSVLRRSQERLGRLHKGTPLHQLGWLRLQANDYEGSTPYILAALIEDAIRDPVGFSTGPAAEVCLNILGKRASLFDEVREFINAELPGPSELALMAERDPEILSLLRSMNDPPGSQLLRVALHFDPAIGTALNTLVDSTKDETGRLFEMLMAYVMRTIGRFDTRGRVRTLDGEDDLILRDTSGRASALGDYLLVECKNWERPVGAAEIKKFSQNVRAASCHSGIVATRKGITGREDDLAAATDARYTVRRLYHRDGIVLIVLSSDDLDRVIAGEVGLRDLLTTKYEEIRFDERRMAG